MSESPITPGEVEVYGTFRKHLGPRFAGAGLGVQFHYNQTPGIHFKTEPPAEYREGILKGLRDGLALRFPLFPASATIWVTRIDASDVDSSWMTFYQAARMVIEQAYSLTQSATRG
jgi:hypothetical protein